MNRINYIEIRDEIVNLLNKKGLTIRQALEIFDSCSDYLLDEKISNNLPQSKCDSSTVYFYESEIRPKEPEHLTGSCIFKS